MGIGITGSFYNPNVFSYDDNAGRSGPGVVPGAQ